MFLHCFWTFCWFLLKNWYLHVLFWQVDIQLKLKTRKHGKKRGLDTAQMQNPAFLLSFWVACFQNSMFLRSFWPDSASPCPVDCRLGWISIRNERKNTGVLHQEVAKSLFFLNTLVAETNAHKIFWVHLASRWESWGPPSWAKKWICSYNPFLLFVHNDSSSRPKFNPSTFRFSTSISVLLTQPKCWSVF